MKKHCRRAQVAGRPTMLRRYDKVVALTSRANTSPSGTLSRVSTGRRGKGGSCRLSLPSMLVIIIAVTAD